MATLFKRALWALIALTAMLIVAGQASLFAGSPPAAMGVSNGRLAPPSATPNSVSSQAGLYPDHPQRSYASMEPLRFSGDGAAAMQKLATVVRGLPGARVTAQDGDYLRAEATTRWLGFRDDIEFVLDRSASVIHFRSASRLGSDDLGVNRARMETVRARFTSP
jgi:uncharacterized protein (DUF1499 family)